MLQNPHDLWLISVKLCLSIFQKNTNKKKHSSSFIQDLLSLSLSLSRSLSLSLSLSLSPYIYIYIYYNILSYIINDSIYYMIPII